MISCCFCQELHHRHGPDIHHWDLEPSLGTPQGDVEHKEDLRHPPLGHLLIELNKLLANLKILLNSCGKN